MGNENLNLKLKNEEETLKDAEREVFNAEMTKAEEGSWDLDDSRFRFAYVKQYILKETVYGLDIEKADMGKRLMEANNEALERLFESEKVLISEKNWSLDSSFFRVSGYNRNEVNLLKAKKYELFTKLKSFQKEQEELEKQEIERVYEQSSLEESAREREVIESGEWIPEESYFAKLSFDSTLSEEIIAKAKINFKELEAYNAVSLSKREQVVADEAYQKEHLLASQGDWISEESYFGKIMEEPKFKQFTKDFRDWIKSELLSLGMINFQGKSNKAEEEINTLETDPDPLNRAAFILGLAPGESVDEVRKAYRKFMMSNHPDRNVGKEVDSVVEAQVIELTGLAAKLW
jgi:hypothetical protein